MRPTVLVGVVALFLGATLAGDAGEPDKEAVTADFLQGEWEVKTLGFAGYEVRGTAARPFRVTFAKDQMTTKPGYALKQTASFNLDTTGFRSKRSVTFELIDQPLEATLKLDAGKTPAHLDVEERLAGEKATRKGICRRAGDGLEICLGSSRPKEFKTDDGCLLQLKRVEKKK